MFISTTPHCPVATHDLRSPADQRVAKNENNVSMASKRERRQKTRIFHIHILVGVVARQNTPRTYEEETWMVEANFCQQKQ